MRLLAPINEDTDIVNRQSLPAEVRAIEKAASNTIVRIVNGERILRDRASIAFTIARFTSMRNVSTTASFTVSWRKNGTEFASVLVSNTNLSSDVVVNTSFAVGDRLSYVVSGISTTNVTFSYEFIYTEA